jgi:hypothetical protein
VVAVQGHQERDPHRDRRPDRHRGVHRRRVNRDPGQTHTLTNVGDTRYIGRITELKTGGVTGWARLRAVLITAPEGGDGD